MKYTYLFLLLLPFFACDKDDQPTAEATNSATVTINGDAYFKQENNPFNFMSRDIDSDGNESFTLVLFATGREDEAEDWSTSIELDGLGADAELVQTAHFVSFTQIGNDCSGTLFLDPNTFTSDLDRRGDFVSGTMAGKFYDFNGDCETDVKLDFSNFEVF